MTKRPSSAAAKAKAFILDLFVEDEDSDEPFYDPVHVGGAVVVSLAVVGILYWLLWTLFVYEGGIFAKLAALAKLLFTSATLKDLGYEGWPYAMGAFEGWPGNLGALVLTLGLAVALRRLFARARRRSKQS